MNKPLLEVKNLVQRFRQTRSLWQELTWSGGKIARRPRFIHAVNGVSFSIGRGEVFSIVGESGCGKSTTARTVIKLLEPYGGEIWFDGTEITRFDARQMLPFRRRMQMVFQNPYASLNPRHTVMRMIAEPMLLHGQAKSRREAEARVLDLLDKVGLRSEHADRFPHQFSGGQRQRLSMARALATNPEFIIADEPVSALDVSIQAQILNLLIDLREEFKLSYLFIAHDLAVVRHISDRVGVMYLGRLVEVGSRRAVFENPLHPYTRALLAAVPVLGRKKPPQAPLEGDITTAPPDPFAGCVFSGRCPEVLPVCREAVPEMKSFGTDHWCACHRQE